MSPTSLPHRPAYLALPIALPVALAVLLYAALLAWLLQRAATDNGVVYAMDDIYIHMALAKNLVLHGVWGVTPWETTNASSSPLWVALLALGFAVSHVSVTVPLILAAASSLLAVLSAVHCLATATPAAQRGTWPAIALFLVTTLAVVAFASLPALTLQGMEHPLHAALLLLAALLLSRAIATGSANDGTPSLPGYVLLIAALPLLRYESLWLIVLGAVLLALRRRYALAALTLACGIVPIAAFGLWAVAHGQTFLPAAILTKSLGPAWLAGDDLPRLVARFTWHPLQRLWRVPLLMLLWLSACGVLTMRLLQLRMRIVQQRWLVLLGLFAVGAWTHATFATFGWGSRYEAYLIVLGIVALGCWLLQADERRAIAALLAARPLRGIGIALAALVLVAFFYTGATRLAVVSRNAIAATQEVRDRDLYIAHFLAQAYPGQGAMAMNVGAIAWLGEPHLTDALALGTTDVLRLFLRGALTPQSLDAIAAQRDVKVAVIFDDWFADWTGGKLPWLAVAEVDPHAGRDLRYTLYARNEADARVLATRLQAFKPEPQFRSTIRLLPPYR